MQKIGLLILFTATLWAQSAESAVPSQDDIAKAHAALAYALYSETATEAEQLLRLVKEFVAAPDAARLDAARAQWIKARKIYGRTEVLRFSDGPIDDRNLGKEPLINAWPVDESYIDEVRGRQGGGIIGDPERFPQLNPEVLIAANERGGEANVCTGWHAIEFLIFGQDFVLGEPGRRSAEDFVDGKKDHADRRRQFLVVTTELLVQHLQELVQAWAPEAENYRRTFLALAPKVQARRLLTGMIVLSGFELCGERMAVALETGEQEDEHSCFSDTTRNDMIANQEGIALVWHGLHKEMKGVGVRALALAKDPAGVAEVDRLIARANEAMQGLSDPFELGLTKDLESPHRNALLRAIVATEQQAEALAAVALKLGFDIPLLPGG